MHRDSDHRHLVRTAYAQKRSQSSLQGMRLRFRISFRSEMVLRNPRLDYRSRTAAASKTFKTSESDDIAKPSHSVASRNSSFRRLAKEFRISTGWSPILRATLNSWFSPSAIDRKSVV